MPTDELFTIEGDVWPTKEKGFGRKRKPYADDEKRKQIRPRVAFEGGISELQF